MLHAVLQKHTKHIKSFSWSQTFTVKTSECMHQTGPRKGPDTAVSCSMLPSRLMSTKSVAVSEEFVEGCTVADYRQLTQ